MLCRQCHADQHNVGRQKLIQAFTDRFGQDAWDVLVRSAAGRVRKSVFDKEERKRLMAEYKEPNENTLSVIR